MNDEKFRDAVERMPLLFDRLIDSDFHRMKCKADWEGMHAIYVFYEPSGRPCHVGRTRNLQSRIRSHTASNHNSASFAFKRARNALGLEATYRPEGSRASLMKDATFKVEFDRLRVLIREMKVRFVEVRCPIEQYLFEVYVALRLGTPTSEFTTS